MVYSLLQIQASKNYQKRKFLMMMSSCSKKSEKNPKNSQKIQGCLVGPENAK